MKNKSMYVMASEIKTMREKQKIRRFFLILLVFIFALIFVFACNNDSDSPKAIITDESAPPGESDPPLPDPENEPVQIALHNAATLKFYDGDIIWTWKTGSTAKAESWTYSHENILYELNEFGQTLEYYNLITVPDYIRLNGSDKWIVYNMSPEEAQAGGAQYKDYTKIYLNSSEYGSWGSRQWKTDKLEIINDDVFVRSDVGAWTHINGTKDDIRIIVKDGFACYDYDSGAHTAKIDGIDISWITNYMNGANYWLESGDTWYSQNGYTWNGSTLDEDGSILTEWRQSPYLTGYTESPVIISAGTHLENSEDVLYFIECNSGWIIKYISSTNQHSLYVRLYTGDGLRTTGLYYQNLLKPCIASGYLYFIFDANYYRYNFSTGLTGHFTNGISEIWEY